MPIETGTYIADFDIASPGNGEAKKEGDDHIRNIKSWLLNTFAGFSGMILATGTEAAGATVNDYVVTISPAPAAYSTSALILFKATHTNTGAATLAINLLPAKSIKGVDGAALSAGDIESGSILLVFYDGTNCFLLSGNDRAARDGDTYLGTHDFTGGAIAVPTPTSPSHATTKGWVEALAFTGTGYMTEVSQDTTPQLGGALDAQGFGITAIADTSTATGAVNLQMAHAIASSF